VIVVRVELHPASGGPARTLGVAHIINDGTGSRALGDYDVALFKVGVERPRPGQTVGLWRRARVTDFPRTGRLGAWDLLYRALAATVGERNRPVANASAEDAAALRVEVERLRRLEAGVRVLTETIAGVRQRSREVDVLLRVLERLAAGDDPRAEPVAAVAPAVGE
jgi:hypothetical protein